MPSGQATVRKVDIFKDKVWLKFDSGSWEEHELESVRAVLPQGPTKRPQ